MVSACQRPPVRIEVSCLKDTGRQKQEYRFHHSMGLVEVYAFEAACG